MPWQSEGFTDLHSHLVPGVDDGSRTLADSADGLQKLWDAGVRRLVTTPHLDGSLTRDREMLETRLHEVDVAWEALRDLGSRSFPDLEIHRGHEVMLDIPDPDLSDARLFLSDSPYVLVEWPALSVPPSTVPVLERLVESGVNPILAHPERYRGLDKGMFYPGEWRSGGALLQVNFGSLVGKYGELPRRRAITLLERDIQAVKRSDAFIYGSLVARDITSRETLLTLLDHAGYRVFDVNLRPPHYSPERIVSLMKPADFVKFNDEELYEICTHLGMHDRALEACIGFLAEKTDTGQICVTLGKDGAVLFYNSTFYYNKGFRVKVADTVGAGDSFLASIISQLLENRPPQEAIDFACAVGSIVASKNGANPAVSASEIGAMMGIL